MIGNSIGDMNMIVDEVCPSSDSKQKGDSPALTEATSYVSSPEPSPYDDFKNSSIRRNLFKVNKERDAPKETIDNPNGIGSPSMISESHGGILTPSGDENGLADSTSITSSETTAIPSWNLSMKDATEKNVEVPLNHFILSKPVPFISSPPTFPLDQIRPILSSSSSFASEETQLSDDSQPQLVPDENLIGSPRKKEEREFAEKIEQTNKPSMVVEDPPEEPTSCNAALNLTPVQLAEIFLAFGQSARQRYQGSEPKGKDSTESNPEMASPRKVVESTMADKSIGSPPPIMTSRNFSETSSRSENSQCSFIQSIERERDALKITTERDARKILNLQQAVETQKQLSSLKETEIVDYQAKLQISQQQILTLQKEHEDYLEREAELVETIEILKKEFDKMTSLKTVPSDEFDHLKLESSTYTSEIDGFDREAKFADSRAKTQQTRIVGLERSLKQKEKENVGLRKKIDWLNDRHTEVGMDDQDRDAAEKVKSVNMDGYAVSENEEIIEVASSIAVESLLKDIMKRLEAVEIEKNEKETDLTKSKDNCQKSKNIKNHQMVESNHNGVKIDVSEDPDAIEATTLKGKSNKDEEHGNQSNWCCDWSLISGK